MVGVTLDSKRSGKTNGIELYETRLAGQEVCVVVVALSKRVSGKSGKLSYQPRKSERESGAARENSSINEQATSRSYQRVKMRLHRPSPKRKKKRRARERGRELKRELDAEKGKRKSKSTPSI